MEDALRTPDDRFADLPDWPYQPRYLSWRGLRVHYVDEGTGPTVLLIHGEPDWSYMYRHAIARLVAAGYRCIAPDHVGFGRSDKVRDDAWYVIERHVEALRHVIETLDVRDATLVVHDWGGPIGLRQAVDMPERFARIAILNTWLHHEGFVYGDGIRRWRAFATKFEPGTGDLPCGEIMVRTYGTPCPDPDAVRRAYDAPFPGPEWKAGARRFPWCLPFAQPIEGNAADQQRCHDALAQWSSCPVHLIWGAADPIFELTWARTWAARIPGATLDLVAGASHFVAEERGTAVAERLLAHLRS